MNTEALEIIKNKFDNIDGNFELQKLIERNKDRKGGADVNLLQLSGFDKNIKLRDMYMTYRFTRAVPMIIRLIETAFYIIVSQTQTFIYMSMISSMYMNAGIISIFYPITVFGYALMEEARPHRNYWT